MHASDAVTPDADERKALFVEICSGSAMGSPCGPQVEQISPACFYLAFRPHQAPLLVLLEENRRGVQCSLCTRSAPMWYVLESTGTAQWTATVARSVSCVRVANACWGGLRSCASRKCHLQWAWRISGRFFASFLALQKLGINCFQKGQYFL